MGALSTDYTEECKHYFYSTALWVDTDPKQLLGVSAITVPHSIRFSRTVLGAQPVEAHPRCTCLVHSPSKHTLDAPAYSVGRLWGS